jgi:8-oxo-dGTP pyrophosphatase MutT (NUDIX family)
MSKPLISLWRDFLRLFFQRPKKLQVAALCYRGKGSDTEVLLVTSRDTGRWSAGCDRPSHAVG